MCVGNGMILLMFVSTQPAHLPGGGSEVRAGRCKTYRALEMRGRRSGAGRRFARGGQFVSPIRRVGEATALTGCYL